MYLIIQIKFRNFLFILLKFDLQIPSELAQTVVDAGAIAHLAQLTLNPDAKLKRQVFSALSQISKHSVELAEMVVEAEIFPNILTCLKGKHPSYSLNLFFEGNDIKLRIRIQVNTCLSALCSPLLGLR